MLFDVQAALAEILSTPLATPATVATPAPEIAPVSRVSQVSRSHLPQTSNVQALPVSQKSRVSQSQPAEKLQRDGDAFRHGRAIGDCPKTWTGRVVSLDEWRRLSAWDRHGPDGRMWCGICRAWVAGFPDCHGGDA